MMRIKKLVTGLTVLSVFCVIIMGLSTLASGADAPKYPTKPVQIIVSYPPGGTSDIAARLIASYATKKLQQPVQVVNRPGGAGSIGQAEVLSSAPDGYTLLLEAQMAAAMPIVLPKCPFEMEKRTWIASTFLDPVVFIVPGNSKYSNIKEVVERAKSNPKTFRWAATGPSGIATFVIGLILHKNGIKPPDTLMVGFQGSAECVNAVAGGHVDLGAGMIAETKGLAAAGKLKLLALVADKRHPAFPDLPTIAEAGFPGFPPEFVPYNGISGPMGLPQYVVDTWVKVLKEATDDQAFRKEAEKVNKLVIFWGPERSKEVMLRNHVVFKELAPLLGAEAKK